MVERVHASVRVRSPLTDAMLCEQPGPSLRIIVRGHLTSDDVNRLADYASNFGSVDVCISHYSGLSDLSFLQRFPQLRRFDLMDFEFNAFEEFRYLPDSLESIHLHQTKSTSLSLDFLSRQKRLHTLFLEGHRKNIEAISELHSLEDLTLRSITLPDLRMFSPLEKLLSLDLKLGGTKCLDGVDSIGRIRFLELWMIKGLVDLSPVMQMPHLQYLRLETLTNLSVLPSFRSLAQLRRIDIQKCKHLVELSPLAEAPALEALFVGYMRQLDERSFTPFLGHPALRFASIGLGSTKKNEAVDRLLALPGVDEPFVFN